MVATARSSSKYGIRCKGSVQTDGRPVAKEDGIRNAHVLCTETMMVQRNIVGRIIIMMNMWQAGGWRRVGGGG